MRREARHKWPPASQTRDGATRSGAGIEPTNPAGAATLCFGTWFGRVARSPAANCVLQAALASVLAQIPRQLLGCCSAAQILDLLVFRYRPAIDGVL